MIKIFPVQDIREFIISKFGEQSYNLFVKSIRDEATNIPIEIKNKNNEKGGEKKHEIST